MWLKSPSLLERLPDLDGKGNQPEEFHHKVYVSSFDSIAALPLPSKKVGGSSSCLL